jgi:hypothetical protein
MANIGHYWYYVIFSWRHWWYATIIDIKILIYFRPDTYYTPLPLIFIGHYIDIDWLYIDIIAARYADDIDIADYFRAIRLNSYAFID